MPTHVFNIRITVARWYARGIIVWANDGADPEIPGARLQATPALAIWEGWSRNSRRGKGLPDEMRWHEADPETGKLCSAKSARGTVRRDDLGVTWCRGWHGPDVDALLAAAALMC